MRKEGQMVKLELTIKELQVIDMLLAYECHGTILDNYFPNKTAKIKYIEELMQNKIYPLLYGKIEKGGKG